ncbi:MAG: amidohydrolase family protein, partial [Thiohalomonadales bacterium]
QFISSALGSLGLGLSGCQYIPYQGFSNPCYKSGLPKALRDHELVQSTWEGLDTSQVWDCHAHLVGLGDSESKTWINPKMQSMIHQILYTMFKFYINGACALPVGSETMDLAYVKRLQQLQAEMPTGFRFMLLAFDYYHDENGNVIKDYSTFYTPNHYASGLANLFPQQFEWIASIHPYREDSVEALHSAVKHNARAVKWLPAAMGIDPSSELCDPFYEALVKYNLPLLTHVGAEYAVIVPEGTNNDSPLLFRRALDHGVRVIFAHCATLGESVDLDKGKSAALVPNLELFARLLAEKKYESRLFGDISAITQVNRSREMIETIVTRKDWHHRLLYGSDYPLPGVIPIVSPENFVRWGYLPKQEAETLSEVRKYNPILFDIMLKRRIKINGQQLAPEIFETRQFFKT